MISSLQSSVQQVLDGASATREDGSPGVAGAVFGAMNSKGEFLVKAAAGVRGVNRPDEKMTTDTALALFSSTKIITVIACMQLVEKGLVRLDDYAGDYLPALDKLPLIDGTQPKNRITLRMLLCHTCGLTYNFWSAPLLEWIGANKAPPGTSEVEHSYNQPLIFEPGTDWCYGRGVDWAGRVLEKVTGQTLGEYCQENILGPAGCPDIRFGRVSDGYKDRLASMHMRTDDSLLLQIDHGPVQVGGVTEAGGGGGIASIEDYMKILVVLISGGKASNGAVLLKPETVDEMWVDQLAGTEIEAKEPLERTWSPAMPAVSMPVTPLAGTRKGWSLAGQITKDPLPTGRSANSVWWAGMGNLYWSADREKGIITMFGSQFFPYWHPQGLEPSRAAEKLVYDSLQA